MITIITTAPISDLSTDKDLKHIIEWIEDDARHTENDYVTSEADRGKYRVEYEFYSKHIIQRQDRDHDAYAEVIIIDLKVTAYTLAEDRTGNLIPAPEVAAYIKSCI
jgi:hypothetical protein